jgi:hypothetical protein
MQTFHMSPSEISPATIPRMRLAAQTPAYVRCGSKADIRARNRDVRFTPRQQCLLSATSGHRKKGGECAHPLHCRARCGGHRAPLQITLASSLRPLASLLGPSRAGPFHPFLEYVDLAAWLIEGDGNVDSLDYRDRVHRWRFG